MHLKVYVLGALCFFFSKGQAGFPPADDEGSDDKQHQQNRKYNKQASFLHHKDKEGYHKGRMRGGGAKGPTPHTPPSSSDAKGNDKVQLLIKYKNSVGKSNLAKFGWDGKIKATIERYDIAVIETDPNNIETIKSDPNIESVEFDHQMYEAGLRSSQPDLSMRQRLLAEQLPYGIAMVQADEIGIGPGKITICVVDTGYGVGHPDLPTKAGHGVDGWDDGTKKPWSLDTRAHGTHCAGTIGAIGSNNKGVKGVNDDPNKFKFYIAKGLNQDNGSGSWSNIAASVEKCVEAGAKVISMSIQGGGGNILRGVLESAYRNDGVLIVAAAGNWGTGAYSYPASYPSVMSVAAVDSGENHATFSQVNDQVEIAAPGVNVDSTITKKDGKQFDYGAWSGTSMATPHVAGVAAKLLSHFPHCTNYQIRNVLNLSAKEKGAGGCDNYFGHGIVQARRAKSFLDTYGCDAFGDSPDSGIGGCSQTSSIRLPPPPTSPQRAALYHARYGTPGCLDTGSSCNTRALLRGRGNMNGGVESHTPNTLDGCQDGDLGTYLNNESIEKLVVRSIDSKDMQEGKPIKVEATVHVWGVGNYVDIYYASDADNPIWKKIKTFAATGRNNPEGILVFTAQYVLPAGRLQAVRANIRWMGTSPKDFCGGDSTHDGWGEADDLVFAVK